MLEKTFTIRKPEAEKTQEDLAWEKAANAWAALYMIYDDNERHMSDSFWNNHYDESDSKQLHAECVDFAKALLEMGYDGDTDTACEELRPYFIEAKQAS